jgi:hypothetical protein
LQFDERDLPALVIQNLTESFVNEIELLLVSRNVTANSRLSPFLSEMSAS